MADRFPFMRVYAEMASQLNKEDRADFYDALVAYALDDKEPGPSTGAAVFNAARRMVDKWKQTQAAGRARAEKSAGRSLDGRWNTAGSEKPADGQKSKNAGSEKPAKEEKNKRIKDINNISGMDNKNNAAEAAARPPEYAQDIMDAYNNTCTSLPKVRELSRDRVEKIRARLKNHTADDIKTAFVKAEASDFCTGRDGKGSKWCNLDWIIRSETNLLKLLEGNYDNERNGRRASSGLEAADRLADRLINSADPEAVKQFEASMNSGGFTS